MIATPKVTAPAGGLRRVLVLAAAFMLVATSCARRADVLPSTDTSGQGPAPSAVDSGALLAAIGADLPSENVRQVIGRFQCRGLDPACVQFPGWSARWTPTEEPLLQALAEAAGADLVQPGAGRVPPCPWNLRPSEPVGYLAWLRQPDIRADSAAVRVQFTCRRDGADAEAYLHELEYSLRRDGSRWTIAAKPLVRIT